MKNTVLEFLISAVIIFIIFWGASFFIFTFIGKSQLELREKMRQEPPIIQQLNSTTFQYTFNPFNYENVSDYFEETDRIIGIIKDGNGMIYVVEKNNNE